MEEYNIIRSTPEQLGYQDRGILKWQGMFLSDHTDALKKEMEKEFVTIDPKEKMTIEDIADMLHKAYVNKSPVLIQANVIRNGNYYKDLECLVVGQGGNKIFLQLIDGRSTSCTLNEIRNIEMMDPLDWYDKLK